MANPDLAGYLGQRLRTLREDAGLHQEDIAEAARETGLKWTQPTVAQIEKGDRRLALEEFLLLPIVYGRRGAVLMLPALFIGELVQIQLTEETSAATIAIDLMLIGKMPLQGEIDAPFSEGAAKLVKERSALARGYRDRLWPRGRIADVDEALRAANGGAEQKAARSLQVSPEELSVLAFKRWGHSLTDERERRLAERLPTGANARTIQAIRGLITRELLDEITPDLTRRPSWHS